MRLLAGALILLLLLLQYPLWIADDGYRAVWRLDDAIDQQRIENAGLEARNQALSAEVEDLKEGMAAAEEIARSELGMIGPDETLYLVADPEPEDRRSIEVP
jgi:cell division protein FtsB